MYIHCAIVLKVYATINTTPMPPSKRAKLTTHGRPHAMAYSELVERVKAGEMESGEWTDKRNGFSVEISVKSDLSGLMYCSKNKNPFTEESIDPGRFVETEDLRHAALTPPKCLGDRKVFRAISRHLRGKYSYLDPRSVYCDGRQCVLLRAEFCIQRKGCTKQYDDLPALLYEQCVTADDDIDLETYAVSVIVYDAVFEGYPERSDPPFYHRIESVSDVFDGFPRDPVTEEIIPGSERRYHTPQKLLGKSDLIRTLSEHEGVVVCLGKAPSEYWVKIKPDRPVGLEIVAVLDTVGTNGYDKILVAATDGENCRKVVDMIDLASLFQDYERAKQGKAYVNPASIRRNPVSGVIDCKSSSSLAPMLSALFGRISSHGGKLLRPVVVNPSQVRVGTQTVTCGAKRSFHRWFRRMLFLEDPVRVTMSANEYWLVPGDQGEVHLQASRVLAVGNYGPVHFRNLPPIAHSTLLDIASNRLDRDPHELFRLAGVEGVVPFADLPRMGEELFTP